MSFWRHCPIWSERKGLERALFSSGVMTSCTLYCWARCFFSVSVSSSELVLVDVLRELVEVVLVDGPCELDVDPDWRGNTRTGG